ncbi:MAG: methylated-DNA--[protein]-cysteine S-methyltransferase [Desulfobacteraceae bacterium]|nr:MAG: methylated-DNA--[protein]-cysteine S-methyltransferase [Desulfobacteraceae bacterium]
MDHWEKPDRQNPKTYPRHLKSGLIQLKEYFRGQRKEFDLPLNLRGTPFQKKAWRTLLKVPYGQTCSYRDLAIAVGKPKATRAIGGANHRNPIPIIVPCHRVIGAKGALTGYGGGLWRKQWLLEHEKKHFTRIARRNE